MRCSHAHASLRRPPAPLRFALLLSALGVAALFTGPASTGCVGASDEELPTYSVSLRLGGRLPDGGQVGAYTVTLSEGWVVLGDWHLYGMDREAAGYPVLVDPLRGVEGGRKHAGHAHGEAEMEAEVSGTWAIDLLSEPVTLATRELTEGHYFDGSLRLRPCIDTYAPVFPGDAETTGTGAPENETGGAAGGEEPVPRDHDLWGHSLLLRGEATRDASPGAGQVFTFEILVDAEAMLAGLEYGGTVMEGGATRITTRLDLGALLAGVDFATLADSEHHVQIDAKGGTQTYIELKVRLQDPELYVHQEAEPVPPG